MKKRQMKGKFRAMEIKGYIIEGVFAVAAAIITGIFSYNAGQSNVTNQISNSIQNDVQVDVEGLDPLIAQINSMYEDNQNLKSELSKQEINNNELQNKLTIALNEQAQFKNQKEQLQEEINELRQELNTNAQEPIKKDVEAEQVINQNISSVKLTDLDYFDKQDKYAKLESFDTMSGKDNLQQNHQHGIVVKKIASFPGYVELTYILDKKFFNLSGLFALPFDYRDYTMQGTLTILGDGNFIKSYGPLNNGIKPIEVSEDISNVDELKLRFELSHSIDFGEIAFYEPLLS